MKIALYIEDGLEQIVLTPETETEKGIIAKLHDGTRDLSIKRGSFYGCRGGWVRQEDYYVDTYGTRCKDEDSTMIVLRRKPPPDSPADETEVATIKYAASNVPPVRYRSQPVATPEDFTA